MAGLTVRSRPGPSHRRANLSAAGPGRALVTTDLDEARDLIATHYVPHDLNFRGGHADLHFRMHLVPSSRLTVGRVVYGAEVELDVPPMETAYHLNLTLNGSTVNTQSREQAATAAGRSGIVFGPTEPVRARWSPDATQYAIKLPRRGLETHLGRLLNLPIERPIRFSLGYDLHNGPGRSLLSAVSLFYREMQRPDGIAAHPAARAQLEELVLTSMLMAVPHGFTDRLRYSAPPAERVRIRRALDLIHAQPERELTVARLAVEAGVTARSLQRGFQEEVGMSPLAYLRSVRLERVRDDLRTLAGDRTVTEVAMRWGFLHLGRFAEQYRRQFGELPSQTVRNNLRD